MVVGRVQVTGATLARASADSTVASQASIAGGRRIGAIEVAGGGLRRLRFRARWDAEGAHRRAAVERRGQREVNRGSANKCRRGGEAERLLIKAERIDRDIGVGRAAGRIN